MQSDIDRWNNKYANHQYSEEITPDSILVKYSTCLSGKGSSLDLACGLCDNALYLASIGYSSFAVDGSEVALHYGKKKARASNLTLLGFVADLDSYPLPSAYFDAIIIMRYLNRNTIGSIKRAVKPGGILIMQTFNSRFLQKKPTFPKDYVLIDGELSSWFNDWSCIDTNDNDVINYHTESYWIGKKISLQ